MEFYIPNYGSEEEQLTVEEEIERSVTKIMKKIDLRESLPSPSSSKSEPELSRQPPQK